MALQIHKAERKKSKLRCGLVGPAGSGKTYSALRLAKGLGSKIVVIDTENGSADLYANLCEYDVLPLEAPFTAEKYVQAIKMCEEANYDVIIIDSLTHAWAGEGGILDEQAKRASGGKNSYTAWRDVTPKHQALIEAMLQSSAHIIATMRAKTEYVLQENNGKMVPKKMGMAPVQREGMDYEFTVVFDVNYEHYVEVSKDRTDLFKGKIFQITEKTGLELKDWLEGDPTIEYATQKQLKMFNTVGSELYGDEWEEMKEKTRKAYKVESTKDIKKSDMNKILDNLSNLAEKKNV